MYDPELLRDLLDYPEVSAAANAFMFHGTVEDFAGPLEHGGFDGVFWMADNPRIAQTYIPSAGLKTLLSVPSFDLKQRVRPNQSGSGWYGAVKAMGFEAGTPEFDATGRCMSFGIPDGYPDYGAVCEWLEGELGYTSLRSTFDKSYWVKSTFDGNREKLLPSSYSAPGRLFVIRGIGDLNLLDIRMGGDGDLTDPDHLKGAAFRAAEIGGYDGVVINDFCQSDTWGNVGHPSWGVFAHAIPSLRYAAVPATRFDWGETESPRSGVTAAFEEAWLTACTQPALRCG